MYYVVYVLKCQPPVVSDTSDPEYSFTEQAVTR
jgi:hypothetical protein